MKTEIKRMALFIALSTVMAYLSHNALIAGLRKSQADDFQIWNQMMRGEINSELLILGSSRALVQFDCTVIENMIQHSCFNLGLDGSMVNLQEPFFQTYLRYNSAPKTVIQVVGLTEMTLGNPYRPHQYIPYLGERAIYENLVGLYPDFIKFKHVPLYGFIVYKNELINPAIQGLLPTQLQRPRLSKRIKGFLAVDEKWNNDFDQFMQRYPKGQNIDIAPQSVAALKSIIETCQRRNIKVILVFPPAYHEAFDYIPNTRDVIALYRNISLKYNIPFLDYSQSPITQQKAYFYNTQHLNKTGAEYFSKIFALEFLKAYKSKISLLN